MKKYIIKKLNKKLINKTILNYISLISKFFCFNLLLFIKILYLYFYIFYLNF
jgi:hypothetical protein